MSLKPHSLSCLALYAALNISQAWAECEPPHLPDSANGYAICKTWPAYDDQTITALSQIEPDTATEDMGMYSLKLALISSSDGQPLARYAAKSVYSSDTVRFSGLSIDTARYKLAPNVRAFGVSANFSGSSRPNPFGQTVLSLFVREGSTLRPVLKQLAIASSGGEWDTRCEGEFSATKRTLSLASSSHHGFADLMVKSVTTSTRHWEENDTCETQESVGKTVLTTLRYNGQQYVVPEELKGF